MNNYQESDLSNLFIKRPYKRKRISSHDISGGNDDRLHIKHNECKTIADITGPAVITHFWCTYGNAYPNDDSGAIGHELFNVRKIILRVFWDDEKDPSIEAPLGDFFGMGHGLTKSYFSQPLQMSSESGAGFNCFFPMPFNKSARFEILNECQNELVFYFYIDYEQIDKLPENSLYFHACWHREITKGKDEKEYPSHTAWVFGNDKDKNIDGKNNYVALDAVGSGQYVGCNLNIVNLNTSSNWDWLGEGDDMIFIDNNEKPTIYGTGLEDYFNCAWSPTQNYQSMYHGIILDGKDNFKGKYTFYRYHIKDPIIFDKSIKVTFEHGHNNLRSDDYSSTCYWYQSEPHKKFEKMLPVEKRMPINEHELWWHNKVELEKNSNEVK